MSDVIKVDVGAKLFVREVISERGIKCKVMNDFVRHYAILREDHSFNTLDVEQLEDLKKRIETSLNNESVEGAINKCLRELGLFLRFLRSYTIKHNPKNIQKKVRIYLHKIHLIIPVFDYQRARANLKILHQLFYQKNYWPSVSTQLALVIYITDQLDQNLPIDEKGKKFIFQKNIRSVCNCSAYAFHRAKNRLEIDILINRKL
jgi:hypothetical protein